MEMSIRMYVINAFVKQGNNDLMTGNPAAVALLSSEQNEQLSDAQRQTIAAEMNLSETAFVIRESTQGNVFNIRWFTPTIEVDLCGHATLASARAVVQEGWAGEGDMVFKTEKKGDLVVKRGHDGGFIMEFPALETRKEVSDTTRQTIEQGLGAAIRECFASEYDLVATVKDRATLRGIEADQATLSQLDTRGIIVCTKGHASDKVRFYSRFFAPRAGIAEDAVTGSAHAVLAGLYLEIGERGVAAEQLSKRGGWITVGRPSGAVVVLEGWTRLVWQGTMFV